jgi:hypothetical protein
MNGILQNHQYTSIKSNLVKLEEEIKKLKLREFRESRERTPQVDQALYYLNAITNITDNNRMSEGRSGIGASLKFASTNEALQYLSDITGKNIKVASDDIQSLQEKALALHKEIVPEISKLASALYNSELSDESKKIGPKILTNVNDLGQNLWDIKNALEGREPGTL